MWAAILTSVKVPWVRDRQTDFNIQLKIGMNSCNFCKKASRLMYREEFIINNINNIMEQLHKLLLPPLM